MHFKLPLCFSVPREISKDVDKGHVTDSSQQNAPKSTDSSEITLKKISVEVGAEITPRNSVESGGNEVEKETTPPREEESEEKTERISEEIKEEDKKTCRMIKEELTEEPFERKPSQENPESCQTTAKAAATETGEESIGRSEDVLTQPKNNTYTENKKKRPRSEFEKSWEDRCSNEDGEEENDHKRRRITRQDVSSEETPNLPNSKQEELTITHEGENDKPSQECSKDKGMSMPYLSL